MSFEISCADVNIKDENAENENTLDDSSKSNGFLYIDMNDYNENNLDGVEIKEEEVEQVEDFVLEKNGISSCEIYYENNFSPKLTDSQNESILEVSENEKVKFKELSSKPQKESVSVKSQGISNCAGSLEAVRYKLRARTWSQKIDNNLIKNAVKRGGKSSLCTNCGVTFLVKSEFLNHKTERTNFKCLNCRKCFCSIYLLDEHFKLCKPKQNKKFMCKKSKTINNDQNFTEKVIKNHKISLFKCDKCNKCFVKKQNLVSHISKNKCSTESYTCAICKGTYINKFTLKKHIIAHIKSQLQCQNDMQTFKTSELFNIYRCEKSSKNKKPYKNCRINHKPKLKLNENSSSDFNCIIFKDSCKSPESNNNQSSKILNSTVYKCQICKKNYKSLISYKNHIKSHRKIVSNCYFSDKNSKTSTFNSHVAIEKSNQKFKKKFRYECESCGKGFIKLVKLKIHILNIHQGIYYQCKKCKIKFPNQEGLDIHIEKQACQPEDLCTCKTCGKIFAKRDYLKKHQYMHMNALFKCKYCYCAFMKEKSYKRHMEKMNCSKSARKIRMAEFNFKKCRLCEVEYETEELLIKHFREFHIGLEPHQCFCCDSSLPTFYDLQNHIHQHNIQKYTCNLCGKPYTSQEGFRKHRLKHKGAEFKCRFCETEFLNENRFKFHEKTCKKNPESGQEPSQLNEKSEKKDSKPKQSRQLHWESRIIMKRLRGDPKLLTGNQTNCDDQPDNTITSTFFDEPESDSADDRGWFNNYYKTDEDDVAFGLKKTEELTSQECDSDFDVSEFLQTAPVVKKRKKSSPPLNELQINTKTAVNDETDTQFDNSFENSSTDSDEEVQDIDLPIDYNPKKCRLCVISFGQEYELLHHFIKVHPGEYAHKCPQCEVQSPLYAQLKEHLKIHGIGIGIFNCDNCSKQFKSEKKMNSHKIRCKGMNKINESAQNVFSQSNDGCKRCGKKFYSKFSYRKHKQLCKKQKKKIKRSEKCSCEPVKLSSTKEAVTDVFGDSIDFQSYSKENDEEEPALKSNDKLVCEDSPLAVNKKSKSTELIDDSVNTTKSQVKGSKTEAKSVYIGEPPMDSFPCRLCDKKFQYERGIVMHFKSAHPGHKPLICQVCNMHLADKLKEHLKTHGIGEEFICELCGKRFNQKFLSKIHEMWHQGIEYKCNNCKQKFLNKEKMDKHIGENRCSNRQSLMRLPCDICGKSYRSKFGLSKHYITHTPKELRPVKNRMNCEYCGKWFEYNNGLQRHRRIHTGERPFCCRFCPKAFAQEGNCKAHERIHTGESKPRKKKALTSSLPSNMPQSSTVASQLSSLPPTISSHLSAPVSTVQLSTYPGQINCIYNNIDSSGIVH